MNDGQRVTWTAILVMFPRENNFEAIVGGFRAVGKENLSIFSSPEGKRLMLVLTTLSALNPGDFFNGCSITTVCTDSGLYEALNY